MDGGRFLTPEQERLLRVPGEALGRFAWPLLPWISLAIIFGATVLLPPVDCYGEAPTSAFGTTPFIAAAALAVAALVVGAAVRVVGLVRGPGEILARDWTLFAFTALAAVAAFPLLLIHPGPNVVGILVCGFALAVATYLWMSIRLLAGAEVDDLGLLVPIAMLLVAGLVCVPLAAIILGMNGGALC